MVFEACRRCTFAYTEIYRSVEQGTKHDERECVIYESKRLSRVQHDRSLQTYRICNCGLSERVSASKAIFLLSTVVRALNLSEEVSAVPRRSEL